MADRIAYSIPEFAAAVGLGKSLIYELVKRGEIPSIRVGRRILIPRSAAEEWLRRKMEEQK
ncbi:excisionase family DNA-binding protein [Ammonifex degensii]|nr:helix-turn-helix domain-containing protein [Ammonifex degensii]